MPSVAAIKTQIQSYLDRTDDLLIETWIQIAHREIQRRHNFRVMEAQLDIPLVANTISYTLPVMTTLGDDATYMKDFRWTAYSTAPVGGAIKQLYSYATHNDILELHRRSAGTTIVFGEEPEIPRFIILRMNLLYIWPNPTTASLLQANTIAVFGWRFTTCPTVASGLSDWFTDNAHDYILYRALLESVTYLSQPPDRIAAWNEALEKATKDIVMHDASSKMATQLRIKS